MKIADPRQKKSKNLQKLIAIALMTSLFLSLFGVVLFQFTKSTIASQLGVTAQSTANAAAGIIMADLESYRAQADSGDTNADYYRQMQEYLQAVITGSNVRHLFVETRLGAEEAAYVVGSDQTGGPYYRAPGTTVAIDSVRYYAYVTKQPYSSDLYTDEQRGQWVEAYAPILDESGTVLGLVGAEIESDTLFTLVTNRFAWIITFCIVAFSLFAYFILRVGPHIVDLIIRDELTGAYNKRYLKRTLSRHMKRARRAGTALSVLTVHVDHLADLNNNYGRAFGDMMLRYFSMRVMNTLRKNDCYVRIGDGTFVVVLPNTSVGMSARVGERIRRIAENYKVQQISAQHSVNVTVSIGGAGLGAHSNYTQLLGDSELALRTAIERRNAVAILELGAVTIVEV